MTMIFGLNSIKKILILFYGFILTAGNFSHDRTIEAENLLPQKRILLDSITKYYTRLEQYHLADLKRRKKGLLFQLLPILGFNFIPATPIFSISSQPFQKNLSKLASSKEVFLELKVQLQEDILQINYLHSSLEELINLYNQRVVSFTYLTQIETIKRAQYEKLEISPIEYFQFMRAYEENKILLMESYNEILKKIEELKKVAKFNSEL